MKRLLTTYYDISLKWHATSWPLCISKPSHPNSLSHLNKLVDTLITGPNWSMNRHTPIEISNWTTMTGRRESNRWEKIRRIWAHQVSCEGWHSESIEVYCTTIPGGLDSKHNPPFIDWMHFMAIVAILLRDVVSSIYVGLWHNLLPVPCNSILFVASYWSCEGRSSITLSLCFDSKKVGSPPSSVLFKRSDRG